MTQKWHKQNFYFIFQHNLPKQQYVCYICQKALDASQIEFCWHAVQIRPSTQWPVWSYCHRGTTSSDDEIDRRHWVLDLFSRVGMTTIPIQCSLLQPAEQEQGSKMMTRASRPLSHTWRACNKNSVWLASNCFLMNVTYALLLRVIMLNNNIKMLLLSFARHTELQNFLKVLEGPRRRFHSCTVPCTHNTFGIRSFAVAGQCVWNSLPVHLHDEYITYKILRHELKTNWF